MQTHLNTLFPHLYNVLHSIIRHKVYISRTEIKPFVNFGWKWEADHVPSWIPWFHLAFSDPEVALRFQWHEKKYFHDLGEYEPHDVSSKVRQKRRNNNIREHLVHTQAIVATAFQPSSISTSMPIFFFRRVISFLIYRGSRLNYSSKGTFIDVLRT